MNRDLKLSINKPNIIYIFCVFLSMIFINMQPLTSRLSLLTAILFGVTAFSFFIIFITNRSKVRIQSTYLGFWVVFVFFTASLISTINYSQSLKYIFFYFITVIMLSVLKTDSRWFSVFWKIQLTCALIHALITLLSYFNTNLYVNLFVPLLNESSRKFTLSYLNNFNFHSGIAGQTGTNAFYLSTGLGMIVSIILTRGKKYKKSNAFLALIFIFALFLTGKRGLLLANFIAIMVVYYMHNVIIMTSKHKKIFKYFGFVILSLSALYISYMFIPSVHHALIRVFNNTISLSGDISSGRFGLYIFAWRTFLENPLIGVGVDAFRYVSYAGTGQNVGAHNDLLQFMAEIGIIGTTFLLILVITILKKTVRLVKNSEGYVIYKPFLYASMYCQIYLVIYSLVGMPFHNYSMLLTYMIFISITYAVENQLVKQKLIIKEGVLK